MKNIIRYTLALSTVLFVAKCDLEEELIGNFTEPFTIGGDSGEVVAPPISSGEFDGSSQSVSDRIQNAFDRLRDGTAGHNGYWSIMTVSADDILVGAKGGDWYDGGTWVQIHTHTNTSTHEATANAWNSLYTSINEVNNTLGGDGLSANETAQLRVLRAFFYWRLLDGWGNVKVVTSPGQDAPQSSRSEVFDFVEQEVLEALGISEVTPTLDLSSSALTTTDKKYRINQYAALALLARLYLNADVYSGTARYEEADYAASYIIDNGPYMLSDQSVSIKNLAKRPAPINGAMDPDQLTGYAAVFAPNNQNNPEIIWSVNFDPSTGQGMNFNMMTQHYLGQNTYNFSAQPWNGYQTVQEFYETYDSTDSRRSNFLAGQQYDFAGRPLLDWAADDINETGGRQLELEYTPYVNELEPNSCRQCGVRMNKFSFRQYQTENMENDFPLFRLGEVYLNRGEARARAAGNWSLALSDVNMIRRRASVSEYSSITADEYLAERGREFYQEALRRVDLIRFGKWGDSWWEKPPSEDFRILFPIPEAQIQASNGTLTQNPGY